MVLNASKIELDIKYVISYKVLTSLRSETESIGGEINLKS